MSILAFIESMPAVKERRSVLNALEQLKMEYDDTLAPFIDDVRTAFDTVQPKSVLLKRMDTITRRYVSFQGNSFSLVLNNLANIRNVPRSVYSSPITTCRSNVLTF